MTLALVALLFVIVALVERRANRWRRHITDQHLLIVDILARLNDQDALLMAEIESLTAEDTIVHEMHMN